MCFVNKPTFQLLHAHTCMYKHAHTCTHVHTHAMTLATFSAKGVLGTLHSISQCGWNKPQGAL